ncbi:MAG: hypothetical protein WBF71_09180 [Microthrixaceae bacterium]
MNGNDVNGAAANGSDPKDRGVAGDLESTDVPAETEEGALTVGEEQQLRSLMQRAAAGLSVETPHGTERLWSESKATQPEPARWNTGKFLGVAAALVIVVAIAGALWQRGDTDRQLAATAGDSAGATAGEARAESSAAADSSGMDAGKSRGASEPAEAGAISPTSGSRLTDASGGSFIIDSEALAAGGIWRLPDGSETLEVTDVQAYPHESGFQIAVDDVDDPSRWFAVLPTRYWMDVGGLFSATGPHELANSMHATVLRPDEQSSLTGSTWIDLRQNGDPLNSLTFVYRGVPDAEALSIVKDVATSIIDLADAAAVRAALVDLRVPDGLRATWDPERVGYPSSDGDTIEALDVTVRDSSSDDKFSVSLTYSGLPPTVARLEQMFGVEASFLNAADGSPTTKVELHPGILKMSAGGLELLMAFTQDGVGINVDRVSKTHEGATISEQVRVLNALRPVSEADFRARMRDLGVEIR